MEESCIVEFFKWAKERGKGLSLGDSQSPKASRFGKARWLFYIELELSSGCPSETMRENIQFSSVQSLSRV